MGILDLAFFVAVVVALAYVLRFSEATLSLGRELSDADSQTGFQDAITPPWQTKVAFAVYASCIFVIGVAWESRGWMYGVGALAAILLGAMVIRRFLPHPDSEHFRKIILASMSSRYANYVRDGDLTRASAMKLLLDRAGFDMSSTDAWSK